MNKGRVIRTQSLRQRGAYPCKLERVVAKLGLSVTVLFGFNTKLVCSWAPAPAVSGEGAGVQQGGCRTTWLQDLLEKWIEKPEQKREETRKIQTLELRFMSFAPLKPLLWDVEPGGDRCPGCREERLKASNSLVVTPSMQHPLCLPPRKGRIQQSHGTRSLVQPNLSPCGVQPVSYQRGMGGRSWATPSQRERWEWERKRHHENSRVEGCSGNSKKDWG